MEETHVMRYSIKIITNSYDVMMMHEIQGVQNRHEKRMEENERRVAQ